MQRSMQKVADFAPQIAPSDFIPHTSMSLHKLDIFIHWHSTPKCERFCQLWLNLAGPARKFLTGLTWPTATDFGPQDLQNHSVLCLAVQLRFLEASPMGLRHSSNAKGSPDAVAQTAFCQSFIHHVQSFDMLTFMD
eukprot:1159619-Pelagomonas_calceolata.AAC.4